MFGEWHLTPVSGALLVLIAVVSGHRFRRAWKEQEPGWRRRAWFYGLVAGLGLLTLAFVPLKA